MKVMNWLQEKAARLAERAFALTDLDGHVRLGPLTLYGANAMDWAVNLRVDALGVTLCAKPPTARRDWYFFASPNATPWAAVLGCGPGFDSDVMRVRERLAVIAESPRPETEAEKLWMLWARTVMTPPPNLGSGGSPEPSAPVGERLGPTDPRAGAHPVRVRRFTTDGIQLGNAKRYMGGLGTA